MTTYESNRLKVGQHVRLYGDDGTVTHIDRTEFPAWITFKWRTGEITQLAQDDLDDLTFAPTPRKTKIVAAEPECQPQASTSFEPPAARHFEDLFVKESR